MLKCALAAVLTLSALPTAGAAQQPAADAPAPERPGIDTVRGWLVQIEPQLWVPSLTQGHFTLPNAAGAAARAETADLGLDKLRAAPAGEAMIRAGRFSAFFSGFGFGIDTSARIPSGFSAGGLAFGAGETVESRLRYSSFKLNAGCRFDLLDDPQSARDFLLSADVYGGAQVFDLDLRLTGAAGTTRESGAWVHPIVGGRVNLDLPHRFGLELAIDGGGLPLGDRRSYSFDIVPAFNWRPVENVGLQVGYRYLFANLRKGDASDRFEFNNGLAGLFASVIIRF
ncbi:MAG: hypothetical protein IBJ11_03690 [Phycisphaerales bacterium]|nr:hypothetical protein [Phycisphaerales bacterium]